MLQKQTIQTLLWTVHADRNKNIILDQKHVLFLNICSSNKHRSVAVNLLFLIFIRAYINLDILLLLLNLFISKHLGPVSCRHLLDIQLDLGEYLLPIFSLSLSVSLFYLLEPHPGKENLSSPIMSHTSLLHHTLSHHTLSHITLSHPNRTCCP